MSSSLTNPPPAFAGASNSLLVVFLLLLVGSGPTLAQPTVPSASSPKPPTDSTRIIYRSPPRFQPPSIMEPGALYVINGVPGSAETLKLLEQQCIKQVLILRGAAAAALYGSPAANGAILITTESYKAPKQKKPTP